MKKLFVASVLALGLVMASQQTASAWSEFKFSAGVNLGWVGGGNRILWGAYHSAPYPGGQDLGPFFPGLAAAANNNQYFGYPPAPAYGAPPVYGVPAVGAPAYVAPQPAPLAPPHPPAPSGTGVQQTYYGYYDGGYQSAGYYPNSYYTAPSYWYGR
jgi:hypothetical protein